MGPNERIASARRIARDGLAQQRAAAGGAAVWWGAPGFPMPRYGSFPASTAWVGSGMGYCADGKPRDLVGSKIAEAHVHWGKHRERVMVQHVVGESRQHNVVAQGPAGGTNDVEVRSVGKQDLQWMLVQWQQDQHARRNIVEREGSAWVSWQQELEALRALDARQRQIVGMAELAASVEREQDMLSKTRSSGGQRSRLRDRRRNSEYGHSKKRCWQRGVLE